MLFHRMVLVFGFVCHNRWFLSGYSISDVLPDSFHRKYTYHVRLDIFTAAEHNAVLLGNQLCEIGSSICFGDCLSITKV
jgi:hypothetical protein